MKGLFFFNYTVAMILLSIVMLTIYAAIQQNYRTGLNDPQMQIARDLGMLLEKGKPIDIPFGNDLIDISKSLSSFIVFYDAAGKPIRSNGLLDGRMPQIPVSVFDIVKNKGEDDVSWQPRRGIRMAMVIVKTNAGSVQYVAAGRSMYEVENRIRNMSVTILIAWMISISLIFLSMIFNYSSYRNVGKGK